MSNISAACIGKWPDILAQLGVDQSFLKNKHGPCPICEGTDRFRFDNRNGKGSYFCSGCGAGDGFTLLQKMNGWTFSEAANEIEKIIGKCHSSEIPSKTDLQKNEVRLKKIHAGLKRITSDDVVSKYLLSRGINILPKKDVYFHPGLDYWAKGDDGPVKVGTFPAMVSIVRGVDGQLVTYHVTYLTDDGRKIQGHPAKKVMSPILELPGAAIQLGGLGETLGIAEGVENALAAQQDEGYPCWACSSANLLEQVRVPDFVRSVVIYTDEDKSFTGQKAAYTLAHRLKREGKQVFVTRLLGGVGSPAFVDTGLSIDYCDFIKQKDFEVF